MQDLQWAQLQWDEGPDIGGPKGPYRQSERTNLYRRAAQKLLDSAKAYRCFCSPERLNSLAEHRHRLGLATDYDRTCASIPSAESEDRAARGDRYTIRFRVPDQYPPYRDLVHGKVKSLRRPAHVTESSFEDPILLKSDGFPTYHLANVVDDHQMEITHVIRGSEWMPSTPNHIAMYDAFAWTPPQFAHVGLLVDETGHKLSKRNFDTDISAFKEMEIFPETLTNFAALLGWSHHERSDVMDLATLIKNFSLKFTKGNTIVTFHKMQFLQKKHALVRALAGGDSIKEQVDNVTALLASPDSPYPEWKQVVASSPIKTQDEYIERIIQADGENYTNSNEFLYRNAFFFKHLPPSPGVTLSPSEMKPSSSEDIPELVKTLALVCAHDWTRENLENRVHLIIDGRSQRKKGAKDVYHYLRAVLTGQDKGMRIYDIMLILGRQETLRRLGVREGEEVVDETNEKDGDVVEETREKETTEVKERHQKTNG